MQSSLKVLYEKLSSNFDSAKWSVNHRTLLDERISDLQAKGFTVYIEGENWFEISGRNHLIKVSGKPDILVLQDEQAWVRDCKTGRKKGSDLYQVLLYMLLVPLANSKCQGVKLEGRLLYADEILQVSSEQVNEEFKAHVRASIALLSSTNPTQKVPSFQECRFCDISCLYCPERIDSKPDPDQPDHELF